MESRHLGLFLPGEIDRLRERIGRLADQMEKSIAVDRVLEVAGMLPLRIENKEKEKAENESMEAPTPLPRLLPAAHNTSKKPGSKLLRQYGFFSGNVKIQMPLLPPTTMRPYSPAPESPAFL